MSGRSFGSIATSPHGRRIFTGGRKRVKIWDSDTLGMDSYYRRRWRRRRRYTRATLDQIRWFESRPLGDADGNGQFDSADLIHVLSQGRYENGIPASATFDQGDSNGDGVFDSSDFVAVFQAGSYEAAAHGAAANRRLLTREALARRADEQLPVLTRSISATIQDDSQVEFDTAPH